MKKKQPHPRDILKTLMEKRGLKPHPWAQRAGIRSSTLYNFLSGGSESLSSETLTRLARVEGMTVDELLGLSKPAPAVARTVPLIAVVGIHGRLFAVDREEQIERPGNLPEALEVVAARVDADALHPIPAGWLVIYEREGRDPADLIGKLAVVRPRGGRNEMIREVRRGSMAGLYTLIAWTSGVIEDVEIESAHAVVSLQQPVSPIK